MRREEAAPGQVGAVMLRKPKTVPHDVTVGAARAMLSDPKVVSAVVTRGEEFLGLLDREDLPEGAGDTEAALPFVRAEVPTVTPETPVGTALEMLDAAGTSRLVVLGAGTRTLVGLVCLDRQRAGFCTG